jgi:hypothetical protein
VRIQRTRWNLIMLSNRTVYAEEYRHGFGRQIGSTERSFDALYPNLGAIYNICHVASIMLHHLADVRLFSPILLSGQSV